MENPIIEEIKPKAVISEDIENWLISTKGKDENQMIYQLLDNWSSLFSNRICQYKTACG